MGCQQSKSSTVEAATHGPPVKKSAGASGSSPPQSYKKKDGRLKDAKGGGPQQHDGGNTSSPGVASPDSTGSGSMRGPPQLIKTKLNNQNSNDASTITHIKTASTTKSGIGGIASYNSLKSASSSEERSPPHSRGKSWKVSPGGTSAAQKGGRGGRVSSSSGRSKSRRMEEPSCMVLLKNRVLETSRRHADGRQIQQTSSSSSASATKSSVGSASRAVNPVGTEDSTFWSSVMESIVNDSLEDPDGLARYGSTPGALTTPLHEALKLSNPTVAVCRKIVQACGGPNLLNQVDGEGNVPLHYAVEVGSVGGQAVQCLIDANPEAARAYLLSGGGGSSPLYRAVKLHCENGVIQAMHAHCPEMLCRPTPVVDEDNDDRGRGRGRPTVVMDTPLDLLWRRYHAQKYECERYFPGDNSLPHVVRHRSIHRQRATETRDVIMNLLQIVNHGRIVHAASALAEMAPLDLVQVIIVKNPNEIGEVDERGRLPLHYAAEAAAMAASAPSGGNGAKGERGHGYQVKFVVETLLRLCPSAATVRDHKGRLPLTLALLPPPGDEGEDGDDKADGGRSQRRRRRRLNMGVIDLLYRAHPTGLDNARRRGVERDVLKRVMDAMCPEEEDGNATAEQQDGNNDDVDESVEVEAGAETEEPESRDDENEKTSSSPRTTTDDEYQGEGADGDDDDAPMGDDGALFVVQRPTSTPRDVLGAMWAHRSDPGLQMLALVSLADMASRSTWNATHVALSGGVAAVVGSMSSHPDEVIVQEKGCRALRVLAPTNRSHEISFEALGATSAVLRAMQDNPSDAMVQREACGALGVLGGKGGDSLTGVTSAGGVAAIVRAMEVHGNDGDVQREACLALEMLYRSVASSSAAAATSASDGTSAAAPRDDDASLYPRDELVPLLGAAAAKYEDCRDSVDFILKRLGVA